MNKEAEDFYNWIKTLSEVEIKEGNEKQHQRTIEEYEKFLSAYKEHKCYICNSNYKTFSKNKICLHWLTKPKGFKKKDFSLIYKRYGFFQIQSYLRWLANQEKVFGNINDLVEESDTNKIIDITINYKNLEWSFSCSQNDYKGHGNFLEAKVPHYHFQMRIDKNQFINYSDYHIPFSKYDIIILESIINHPDKFKHTFSFGEGMESALTELEAEEIITHSKPTEDENKATFKFDSFVVAKPGAVITDDDINSIIEKSKSENVPIASLLKNLDADVTTFISPAPAVPEIAHRTKRNRGRKNKS